MDCSVVPLRKNNLSLISTTDFFYPLVDDPYIQGKIGCANVLSDLYSMGVVNCDNILMILASSREMPERERNIVTQQMMQGFNDLATEAETEVTGGQTVLNPWPIIGGAATSVCDSSEFILPVNARAGDVVVLTKPLGTQVAVNAHQWYALKNARWESLRETFSEQLVEESYQMAIDGMVRLNRNGARLMHKYSAHAATDVTGFGILGHASNLAQNQTARVNIQLDVLPIIRHLNAINNHVNVFKLLQGTSAETSGGLLICLPAEHADAFVKEIQELDGAPAWIIGKVVENISSGPNSAYISENVTVIDV